MTPTQPPSTDAVLNMLRAARIAEKEQAMFYRGLAADAEECGASDDIEALNGLLADEQHHLSRLTARLVELGAEAGELHAHAPSCEFDEWREIARRREQEEIRRYERLAAESLDEETSALIQEFLMTERQHEQNLGGKYTEA